MEDKVCKWCGCQFNTSGQRSHCRKVECRRREIDINVRGCLTSLVALSKHISVGEIEIRSRGADKLGEEMKLTVLSSNGSMTNGFGKEAQGKIRKYLWELLFSGIKGNCVISIADGNFNGIQGEFFVNTNSPKVFTGSKIVSILTNKGGISNGNNERCT